MSSRSHPSAAAAASADGHRDIGGIYEEEDIDEPASALGDGVHPDQPTAAASSSSALPFVASSKSQPLLQRGMSPADVAAAARAHRDRMVAGVHSRRPARPFDQLHSSEQIVLLEEDELWPTIVSQWCQPGEERIEEFASTWGGDDLAAIAFHLGVTVKPRNGRRDYWERSMRQQIVDAVRQYAVEHPELFQAAPPVLRPEEEKKSPDVPGASSPPNARLAQPGSRVHALPDATADSRDKGRRSPRGSAASRSADAMRALGQLPLVGPALVRAERDSPEPRRREAREVPSKGRSSHPSRNSAARPSVRLLDVGADDDGDDASSLSSSDGEDESDGDWAQEDDHAAMSSAARRGGRLLRDEFDSRLAESGVQRHSFAKGFLRNALREAAGRTLYQLYKDTVAQWDGASMHCKREALAHARTLDALLQASRDSRGVREALENVCRRLGGVHTAATTGSWEMCDRLEAQTSSHSFVPDYFMATALKQVTREQAIRKSVNDGVQRVGKSSYTQGTGRNRPKGGRSSGTRSSSGGSNGAASSSNSGSSGAGFSSATNGGGSSRSGSRKK